MDEKVLRMDARLKLVKACDEVADALERLHRAVQKADKRDLEVLLPGNPFTAPGHTNVGAAIQMATRETMVWVAHLHDAGRFEQLSTRRFDGST